MSKIRINDLARELEVPNKQILDALPKIGVTEKKTHSSSIEGDEADRVRKLLASQGNEKAAAREQEIKPKIDFSKASKPGDIAAILRAQREAQEAGHVRPATPPAPKPAAPPSVPVTAAPQRTALSTGCAYRSRSAATGGAGPAPAWS